MRNISFQVPDADVNKSRRQNSEFPAVSSDGAIGTVWYKDGSNVPLFDSKLVALTVARSVNDDNAIVITLQSRTQNREIARAAGIGMSTLVWQPSSESYNAGSISQPEMKLIPERSVIVNCYDSQVWKAQNRQYCAKHREPVPQQICSELAKNPKKNF